MERVVDSIVRYLQEPSQTSPGSADRGAGPERYYSDSAEGPGRWLGRTAAALGLGGRVQREDFAAVLAGRDPRTGERLITAQGSAGRRRTLGAGTHSRLGPDGEALFGVADAAALLGVTHAEVERMLDVGAAIAKYRDGGEAAGEPAGVPAAPPAPHSAGEREPFRPPVRAPDVLAGQPDGSFLIPIEVEGSRWVRQAELERCIEARQSGSDPDAIRSLGDGHDQLSIAEAARLAGVTARYLRGLARHHEENCERIEQSVAAGRTPRRAYLVAHRGSRNQWLVYREHLAEFVERRRPPAVRVAYDLTLTTEKSLGVLALLSDEPTRTEVLAAIQAGNDMAMAWLEDCAVARVDGRAASAEGLVVASFRHLTSRSLDPFPHHHNVVANTARMPDGTHRALDARALFANAQAASVLATAEMRHQLTARLGVRWRPGRSGGWEIDGITDGVIREFSRRRSEIEDALAELEAEIGRGALPSEIEHIVLRTRPAKDHTPADHLLNAWRERANRCGLSADALADCVGRETVEQRIDAERLFAELTEPDGVCAGGSVFSRTEALAAIANHPIIVDEGAAQPFVGGATQLSDLTDAFLASTHVIGLTDGDQPLYSTVEMLELQQRIAERFTDGLRTSSHTVSDDLIATAFELHPHLTGEQRLLTASWCQDGHRFQSAIGRAGAGKTTTVAACADAWAAAGYRVLGAAVKGEATRTLADTTGIQCETVAWYLAHTDPQSLPLDSRTILIVDEASTLSDRDLDALMTMAASTGASLRLIGDPAQHSAIAAGGMFRVLCEHLPEHTPELATTHRLLDPHDRAAAEALREGRIDDAFDHLAAAGHLHVVGDDLTMYRHILGRWWDAHRSGLDHPMVDRRNSTRQRLNRLAHLLRQVHGELHGDPIIATGNRSFAIGDRVTARSPNRDLHVPGDPSAYIRNGALGTITALHHDRDRPTGDSLTINFDGIGSIEVPRSFFDRHRGPTGRHDVGIDHAYALTSYAVQGSTRDVSSSRIDATASRAEAYVDITRGRHENHLYLTVATDPLDGETLPRLPAEPADVAVAERLHRSNGELTAWELAHGDNPRTEPGVAVGI